MTFLGSVIDDQTGSAGSDEQAAITAFNHRLRADGHWVLAGGLASPSMTTVIDNRGGTAVLSDGPVVESKEYLSGFWVIEAPDRDVALTLAAEASRHGNRTVQVRPLLGD